MYEMFEDWRTDIRTFVTLLDPDNLELPDDFDPNYYDPVYNYNTYMAWVVYRPGTRFIPEFFTPIDVADDRLVKGTCPILIACNGYVRRPHEPRCEYDYSWNITNLAYWIIFRPYEPIPPELLYERFVWNGRKPPLLTWIQYRKGEPIPTELHDTIAVYNDLYRGPLYQWVIYRNEPIPEILYPEFGKKCDGHETVLFALARLSFLHKKDIPVKLIIAERDIKCKPHYCLSEPCYPVVAWTRANRYVKPPIELYPPELVPNLQEIWINWRENLHNFFLYLDPDNLVLPDDFDPTFLSPYFDQCYTKTLMTLWIQYHQGRDIPDEFVYDIELYKSNPNIVSPLVTWIDINKMGEIPDILFQYMGSKRYDITLECSELYSWIYFRTDEVPELLWDDLESYDHDGIDIVGEWERLRPEQALPDQLIPYIRESDDDY